MKPKITELNGFVPGRYTTPTGTAIVRGFYGPHTKGPIHGVCNDLYTFWTKDGKSWDGKTDLLELITFETHPEYFI